MIEIKKYRMIVPGKFNSLEELKRKIGFILVINPEQVNVIKFSCGEKDTTATIEAEISVS